MKSRGTLLLAMLLCSVYLSCTKDRTPPVVVPTAADTISNIIDSVKGRYRVFVEKDSFDLGFFIGDTLGFDTIEVLKNGRDSISILNYALSFGDNQLLSESVFYFAYAYNNQYAPMNGTANFFLANDSIEFRNGYGGFEWGTYLFYRGVKISP